MGGATALLLFSIVVTSVPHTGSVAKSYICIHFHASSLSAFGFLSVLVQMVTLLPQWAVSHPSNCVPLNDITKTMYSTETPPNEETHVAQSGCEKKRLEASCPNKWSRTEADSPRQKVGQDFVNFFVVCFCNKCVCMFLFLGLRLLLLMSCVFP